MSPRRAEAPRPRKARGHAVAICINVTLERFAPSLVTQSDKTDQRAINSAGDRAVPERTALQPKLSLRVTTPSTADEAKQLQTCSWGQPARPALQRSHIQVPRLVWRDRHNELVILTIKLDVNAPVGM
jgi:hypothetical protein